MGWMRSTALVVTSSAPERPTVTWLSINAAFAVETTLALATVPTLLPTARERPLLLLISPTSPSTSPERYPTPPLKRTSPRPPQPSLWTTQPALWCLPWPWPRLFSSSPSSSKRKFIYPKSGRNGRKGRDGNWRSCTDVNVCACIYVYIYIYVCLCICVCVCVFA